MAKQKINTEEEQIIPTDNNEQVNGNEETVNKEKETINKDDEKVKEEKENVKTDSKNEKPESASSDITPFIDSILKSHPDSDYLYVDTHGGCFTKGTPERIRGRAILYKNPYYKS